MSPERKIRLLHVARLAGVSTSTASRALRGDSRIKAETAARVRAAAEKLDFRPDPTARTLRTQTRELHGLVIDLEVADNPASRVSWLKFLNAAVLELNQRKAAALWTISNDPKALNDLPISTLTVLTMRRDGPWLQRPKGLPSFGVIGPPLTASTDANVFLYRDDSAIVHAAFAELRAAGSKHPVLLDVVENPDLTQQLHTALSRGADGFFAVGFETTAITAILAELIDKHLPLVSFAEGWVESAVDRTITTISMDAEAIGMMWARSITSAEDTEEQVAEAIPWTLHRRLSTHH